MRSGKDGKYYYVVVESDEELENLKKLTLEKIKVRSNPNKNISS
jgi:hypothetical protein